MIKVSRPSFIVNSSEFFSFLVLFVIFFHFKMYLFRITSFFVLAKDPVTDLAGANSILLFFVTLYICCILFAFFFK